MGSGGVVAAGGGEEVAITRKVVRSKSTTSVALHASARVVRCFVSIETLGMRVWTICDQAYAQVDVLDIYQSRDG